MVSAWVLFCAWLRRELTLRKRYAWDTAVELLTGYAVFMLLLLGSKAVGADRMGFGDTEGGIIVGFTILTFVMASYRRLAYSISYEAVSGTLEQFAMSPLGTARVWGTRAASIFVSSALFCMIQLLMMMASTGRWLHLDLGSLLILLVFIYASGQGVGFLLAGFAIVEKQIQQLYQLASWMFLALTMLPVPEFPAMRFLPVAWGTHMARQVMVENVGLADQPMSHTVFLVVHGVVYLVLGLTAFTWCERRARVLGTLGHY